MIFQITAKEKSFVIANRAKTEALEFLNRFILSGGSYSEKDISKKALAWLGQNNKSKYTLYRGLYLIRKRVKKIYWKELNSLEVGDSFPKKFLSSYIKPYTTKLTAARYYAKEGDLNFILKAQVFDVICDTFRLIPLLKNQDILDEGDIEYFKKDREVLVLEPIQSAIVYYKKGKL
jgi:hypothetical protein